MKEIYEVINNASSDVKLESFLNKLSMDQLKQVVEHYNILVEAYDTKDYYILCIIRLVRLRLFREYLGV